MAGEIIFGDPATADLLPWLCLKRVSGIGNHLFKKLLDRFKTPEAVFDAPASELGLVEGITGPLIDRIKGQKISRQDRDEIRSAAEKGYKIVPLTAANYPPLLRQIPDPPPFLYVYGELSPDIRNISMVGSRNATRYGIMTTKRLAEELAGLGITIISGMARGIDAAAHAGAIAAGGKTIAVLGSGLERIYPPQHKKLFAAIAKNGAAVSEFSLTTGPEAHNFPVRNRIISGMSLGVVIVEAAQKSGSLITARLAAEQGREVFAVPGNIRSAKSTGTHGLIKQGAKLVEGVNDIVDELSHVLRLKIGEKPSDKAEMVQQIRNLPPLTDEETKVFDALEAEPIHIDDLGRKVSVDSARLSGILLQLELKGVVMQLPGKRFAIDLTELT